MRQALRNLIGLSGLSRREIEKLLSAQGDGVNLTRLLAGAYEMKVRHVLDITRALGIHPLEFFRLIFEEPEQPSPLLQRVETVFRPGRPAAAGRRPRVRPPKGDVEALRQYVLELMRDMERLSALTQELEALRQEVEDLTRQLDLPPSSGELAGAE